MRFTYLNGANASAVAKMDAEITDNNIPEATWKQMLSCDEGARAVGAWFGRRLVGCVAWYIDGKQLARISRIIVRDKIRLRGVGKHMLRKLPFLPLVAHVPEANLMAQLFFKRVGFVCKQIKPKFYSDGGTAYVMVREAREPEAMDA